MIDQERLTRTLQELVRIPSHKSMEKISDYVASEIRKAGLEPEADDEGNVLASVGSGEGFLLNAHLDTVGVEGYPDAFSGEVRDEKLYGRGSTDCKAGVAAMLEILRVLARSPPRKRVVFAFTVWEEGHGPGKDGAYALAPKIKASHGLVLEDAVKEDGSMGVTIGCKGRSGFSVEVKGKAGHSSQPRDADNPIYSAARLCQEIESIEPQSVEVQGYGELESAISVTEIHAQEGGNVIPSTCSLTVDNRTLPGKIPEQARKEMERLCSKALGKRFSLKAKGKEGFLQHDPAFIRLCRSAVKEACLKPFTHFSPGWNDAAVFNSHGIKTLKMGPGTIGQDHRNPEYCWLPGFVKGTQAILNVIKAWDRGKL